VPVVASSISSVIASDPPPPPAHHQSTADSDPPLPTVDAKFMCRAEATDVANTMLNGWTTSCWKWRSFTAPPPLLTTYLDLAYVTVPVCH